MQHPERSSPSRSYWLVLATALVLRLLWGLVVPVMPVSDSVAYEVFARNIAQGNGYGWEPNQPTAYWPVGASAIYALLFYVFGHSYAAVMLLQAAVGVAVVALAMSLARHWLGQAVALATGWILACWPLLIQYTTVLASELFFIVFVLAAFRLVSLSSRSWPARAAAAGIALAAASYVRPTALVMAPLLYLRDAVKPRNRRRAAVACIVAIAAVGACVLPWTLRNWQVFERFVVISTNGGANLWMGNNPKATTGYMELPDVGISNEADRDGFLGREARRYIAQDPAAFLARMARKLVHLHDRETIGVVWNQKGIALRLGERMISPMKLVSTGYWLAVLVAALCGVVALGRRYGLVFLLTFPPAATWAYFALVHGVTVAGDRYHVPSIPFIAMIAAYFLHSSWAAVRAKGLWNAR